MMTQDVPLLPAIESLITGILPMTFGSNGPLSFSSWQMLGNRGRQLVMGVMISVFSFAATARAEDLSGRWEGRWESCTDRFQGTVNARITRCDENHYRAVFWGRAFAIMPYRYVVTLEAFEDPETGCVCFRCTEKLPLWGWYWMRGSANGGQLSARYNTDDHTGYFHMVRTDCYE